MLSLFWGTSLLAVYTGLFFNNVSAVTVTVRHEPLTSADRFSTALAAAYNLVNEGFHESWKVSQLNVALTKYVSEHDDFPNKVCEELGKEVTSECLDGVAKYAKACKNGDCFHLESELLYGYNGFNVMVFDHYGLLALFFGYKNSGLYEHNWFTRKFNKLGGFHGKGYSSYATLVNGLLQSNITNDAHYSESQVLLSNYFDAAAAMYMTLLNRDAVAATLGNSVDALNVAGVHFKKKLRNLLKNEFAYAKFPVGEKYFKGAAAAFAGYLTSLGPKFTHLAQNFAVTVVEAYEEEALGRPRPWHKKVWDLITGPWKRAKVGEKIRQPFVHAGVATKKLFTETLPQGVKRSNARVAKFFSHDIPKKTNKVGARVKKFFTQSVGEPVKKASAATSHFFTHSVPKNVNKVGQSVVSLFPTSANSQQEKSSGDVDVTAGDVAAAVGDTLGAGDVEIVDDNVSGEGVDVVYNGAEGGAVGGEEVTDVEGTDVGGELPEVPVVEEGVSGEQSDAAVGGFGAGGEEGA